MRILHTADWHLGKTLKGQPLLDDQIHIVDEIFDIIDDDKNLDAVIIAGDVYDRAIPPADAVTLFDETLTKLAERKIPTLIIAGNHDSATRLNFGRELFARQGIYIAAKVAEDFQPVVLNDAFGEVYFTPIPFFEPGEIRAKFFGEDDDPLTFDAANKFFVDRAREKIPAGKRSVAVAHVFLTGGVESESERKFVGGTANVGAETFAGYDYVALGHLHRPQKISAENIRYAGSPLKYSFDEADHKKSVTIVELDGKGFVGTKKILLTPRRDVRIVEGTLFEILKNEPRTQDYISARLIERELNTFDKLSGIFPNLLSVEFCLRQNFSYDDSAEENSHAGGTTLDYFAEFYRKQTGEILSAEYRAAMKDCLEQLARDEREV